MEFGRVQGPTCCDVMAQSVPQDDIQTVPFEVNGRSYRPPGCPVAVICIDGCADEYLNAALVRNCMPNLSEMLQRGGFRGQARAALPTFTNVNNASIVTGVPPSVHGISGNFFLDPDTGEEVMMNSGSYLRAETILAAAAKVQRKVAVVTAKEKLRDILAHNLRGIAFSAEKANQATEQTHGIANAEELVGARTPPIYSADASLFVLASGVALLQHGLADFLYLSLTDYMQHKYAPDSASSLAFYKQLDHQIGRLIAAGALVGATADHGMNAKQRMDGTPNVVYLETLLAAEFGQDCRVVLPITDPYVVHHGSLGSFAVIYLPEDVDVARVHAWVMQLDGVTEVFDRSQAASKLELPEDRIGDLVVLSGRDVVIGRAPEHHDLRAVASGLRSHGGRYEEMVPLFLSESLTPRYARYATTDPRNFDIFDFTLNGTMKSTDYTV